MMTKAFLDEWIHSVEAAGGRANTLVCSPWDVAFIEPLLAAYPLTLRVDDGCAPQMAYLYWEES